MNVTIAEMVFRVTKRSWDEFAVLSPVNMLATPVIMKNKKQIIKSIVNISFVLFSPLYRLIFLVSSFMSLLYRDFVNNM